MKKKACAIVFSVVVAALCCASIVFFYKQVNDGYPAHGVVRYDRGDRVALCGFDERGETVACPAVTLSIEGATMLSAEEFMAVFPDYMDQVFAAGQAGDARFIVVECLVENDSDDDAKTLLGNAAIQTGSYANGIEYSLYQMLNGGKSFTFEAHSSNIVYLTYAIYDASFGFNETWGSIDESSFELVVALYPDKEYVDLGVLDNFSLSEFSSKEACAWAER